MQVMEGGTGREEAQEDQKDSSSNKRPSYHILLPPHAHAREQRRQRRVRAPAAARRNSIGGRSVRRWAGARHRGTGGRQVGERRQLVSAHGSPEGVVVGGGGSSVAMRSTAARRGGHVALFDIVFIVPTRISRHVHLPRRRPTLIIPIRIVDEDHVPRGARRERGSETVRRRREALGGGGWAEAV